MNMIKELIHDTKMIWFFKKGIQNLPVDKFLEFLKQYPEKMDENIREFVNKCYYFLLTQNKDISLECLKVFNFFSNQNIDGNKNGKNNRYSQNVTANHDDESLVICPYNMQDTLNQYLIDIYLENCKRDNNKNFVKGCVEFLSKQDISLDKFEDSGLKNKIQACREYKELQNSNKNVVLKKTSPL